MKIKRLTDAKELAAEDSLRLLLMVNSTLFSDAFSIINWCL